MSKFKNSLEELFSAEAEALNSNSADYIINQFQTNEQEEPQHQAANAGTKPGSREGNAALIDPAVSSVPQGHSEGCAESAGDQDGSAN